MKAYKTRLYCPDSNDKQFLYIQHCISVQHRAYNMYVECQLGALNVYHSYFKHGTKSKNYKKLSKSMKHKVGNLFFGSFYTFKKIFTCLKNKSDFSDKWMLDVPRHTINQGFKDAETAFNNYWHGQSGKPHFKGYKSHRACYFDGAIHVKRDRIKLPKVGWLRLSEYGYIPTGRQLAEEGPQIVNDKIIKPHFVKAYISVDADYYYISVVTNEPAPQQLIPQSKLHGRLGVDLGIKDEAIIGKKHYPNITKSVWYKHMVNYLHRWQRKMSRRQTRGNEVTIGFLKAKYRVQHWYRKIRCFMHNYIRQITIQLIKQHPKSITIEKLNISGMKKNHKLSHAIQPLGWFYFDTWLTWLGEKYGIEIRQVSKYFPSTKLCAKCHRYNHNQFSGTINDLGVRTFRCPYCGYVNDRDENASINLRNCKQYKVLTSFINE